MARKVKCQATGEWGASDVFFQAPNKKYFKSELIYKQYIAEKEAAKKIRDTINIDFLGYREGQPPSTTVAKELNELMKFYSSVDILDTLNQHYKAIYTALRNNKFSSEFACIRYIFAILKNHAKESYDKNINLQKKKELSERECEVIEEVKNRKIAKAKNISDFLEDDE